MAGAATIFGQAIQDIGGDVIKDILQRKKAQQDQQRYNQIMQERPLNTQEEPMEARRRKVDWLMRGGDSKEMESLEFGGADDAYKALIRSNEIKSKHDLELLEIAAREQSQRNLVGDKAEAQKGVLQTKGDIDKGLAGVKTQGALQVAEKRGQLALEVAKENAESRKQVAEINARARASGGRGGKNQAYWEGMAERANELQAQQDAAQAKRLENPDLAIENPEEYKFLTSVISSTGKQITDLTTRSKGEINRPNKTPPPPPGNKTKRRQDETPAQKQTRKNAYATAKAQFESLSFEQQGKLINQFGSASRAIEAKAKSLIK